MPVGRAAEILNLWPPKQNLLRGESRKEVVLGVAGSLVPGSVGRDEIAPAYE